MAAAWDQGEGFKGPTESSEAYDRFVRFLELGPDRTLAALARLLGVTPQNLGQMAKRYNWRKRAEAYDRAKGRKATPKRRAPEIPSSPRAPQSPPPASTAQSVTPEVLGRQATTAQADSHIQALSRYRKAYDAIGSGMADEAQALFPLVRAFRGDLVLAREIWRALLEQQEIERANVMARMLWDLIPAYYRLCEAMHGMASGGRTHWGDAIGVHKILEDAFQASRKPGQ